jgi:hypothetical protein
MVMLNLENVFSAVVVNWKSSCNGRDASLDGLLFGDKGRT